MQHVKISWLRRLNYSLVGVTVLLFTVHIIFNAISVSQAVKAHWGITSLILTFGVVHAIYVIISDRLTMERYPWATTFVSFLIYAFMNASIIEASGNTNVIYRLSYIVLVFLMGMIGSITPFTAVFITWLVLLLSIAGIATPTKASLTFNLAIDSLLTVAGLAGWFIFKRYYVGGGNIETEKLAGILKEEQFKSSIILESITDGVIIINPKGTIQIMNKSASDMLGWEQDEATGIDYEMLLKPAEETAAKKDDSKKTAIALSLETGKPVQKIGLFKTHTKETLYLDIVASPIVKNKDGSHDATNLSGIVAVLRDVSDARAEEHRRADFVSTASHEMRTPVAAIEGYLALALNDRVSKIDGKARGYLEKAHESTQHLGKLFQDLLTSTKAEDGRLTDHPSIIEMSSFTEKAAEDLRFTAEKKGLHMQFVMGTHEGETVNATRGASSTKVVKPLYYVHADPERLREVITNLFDNAVKYTESGTISLGLTGNAEVIQISVNDTGPGIPASDIPHLFQKFYRVDNTATRTIGGTGLGLFICAKIIEMYNGRIWVESQLGKGSTFYINLPRVSQNKLASIQADDANQNTVTPLSSEETS